MNTPREQFSGMTDERYETAIRETVDAVGGILLFQIRLHDDETDHWAAAVAVGEPGSFEIVIIDVPCGDRGGDVSVSPAASSTLPIASIASAYAGLAECWSRAA